MKLILTPSQCAARQRQARPRWCPVAAASRTFHLLSRNSVRTKQLCHPCPQRLHPAPTGPGTSWTGAQAVRVLLPLARCAPGPSPWPPLRQPSSVTGPENSVLCDEYFRGEGHSFAMLVSTQRGRARGPRTTLVLASSVSEPRALCAVRRGSPQPRRPGLAAASSGLSRTLTRTQPSSCSSGSAASTASVSPQPLRPPCPVILELSVCGSEGSVGGGVDRYTWSLTSMLPVSSEG